MLAYRMLGYAVTIFLSAFLLFAVQPVIAKMILPWFGGTSAVWSTCLLFFQLVLLFGYLYAHWLNRKLSPRRQAIVHSAMLAVSAAALPILPSPHWKTSNLAPSLRILALLAATVGLPYFLLSSTSPLLQAWYARTQKQAMPYRLFALSNLASLLALLSYPLLIEPILPTHAQALVWSAAYVVFAMICGVAAWRASSVPSAAPALGGESSGPPSWQVRLLWFGLAAGASVLLLAVTTHLTQDVAPIPFLWILPLTAYLLTFILCFEAPQLYARPVFLPLFAMAMAFMAYMLWPDVRYVQAPVLHLFGSMTARATIASFAVALFIACMVCHGELVHLKPDPRRLTGFYVYVSLGGAAGGLFVGLAAPNLFRAYYEFPIGLVFTAAVVAAALARNSWSELPPRRYRAPAALTAAVCLYAWGLVGNMESMVRGYRVVARNFYGLLRVYEDGDATFDEFASRKLVHGVINHGEQMLNPEFRRQPVTYFCADSGVGRAMTAIDGRPRRIGILGLGCGTLAAYGRPGDTLRIYEINPLVLDLARSQFTYLADTPARVETALGDGRLTLESEPPQHFDILVMDAFSGDSVPVHLITKEAFRVYFRHLQPDGILAVNITNRYLNLEPVMERAAAAFGKTALVYRFNPPLSDPMCFASSWTLIADRAVFDRYPQLRPQAVELRPSRPFRIWTDDYSNMYSILK